MGSSPSLAVTQGQTWPCYLEDDWRAGGYDRHTEWIVIVRAHPRSAEPPSPQGRDAVLGEPGGRALSRHLADAYGVCVDGVDYAAANTALVQGAAQAAGLAVRVLFTTGDAKQLRTEAAGDALAYHLDPLFRRA
ncbi:hypothetical protein [Streptomyces sp. NPDC048825]|uniref:hypothetical protein n=1 Tax=Streptomyces sp. NPDC048825 TaxID=3365592 RepID=UPI003711ADCE